MSSGKVLAWLIFRAQVVPRYPSFWRPYRTQYEGILTWEASSFRWTPSTWISRKTWDEFRFELGAVELIRSTSSTGLGFHQAGSWLSGGRALHLEGFDRIDDVMFDFRDGIHPLLAQNLMQVGFEERPNPFMGGEIVFCRPGTSAERMRTGDLRPPSGSAPEDQRENRP